MLRFEGKNNWEKLSVVTMPKNLMCVLLTTRDPRGCGNQFGMCVKEMVKKDI